MIAYNSEKKRFKLDTSASSYVFGMNEDGILVHYYYGKPLFEDNVAYLAERFGQAGISAKPHYAPGGKFTLDSAPQEYPTFGTGDYRPEALRICDADGHNATLIHYVSHKIYAGKPAIPGQPSTFGTEKDVMTLEILCVDRHTNVEVTLYYSVFSDLPVITRRVSVKNASGRPLEIERIFSTCVDYHTSDYDLIHLPGRWCRERNVTRVPLGKLTQTISSNRGSSGHFQNPFAAIVSHDATERSGEAYGYNFVYSGNFTIDVDVDAFSSARFLMGMNPDGFGWHLEPGEVFDTPEAVMVYSDEGIGGMSRVFHRFYRTHLLRRDWVDKKRPLLINNWEATYFDFNEEKLLAIAEKAASLGIEMLVLDDGWFGKRANDKSSLGDWFVFEEKLPLGLGHLSDRLHEIGMKFGLWFEPEMVSPDSDLFRAHPDWCLHIDGRPMSLGRWQLVLDLSRPEVVDYIFDSMSKILDSAKIEYIKWDYNRNFTEVGNANLPAVRQKEVAHRYMLGLYSLLDRLTRRYPDLLIEGCSSGGGRFDPAMLYYSPQIWTSDNTDAIERLDIQFGTSMCYPASGMGAHVSACPNHQVCRSTPLQTRGNVALGGTFGYELDPTKFTPEECEIVKQQVADYHKFHKVIHTGDLYRLIAPNEGDCSAAAWEFVSEDKSEALVFYTIIRAHTRERRFLRPEGLDPMRHYRDEETGTVLLGSTLMNGGFNFIDFNADFATRRIHLIAID